MDGIVSRKGGWPSAPVSGDLVMVSVETGVYRIWELIERPTAVTAICDLLVEEYKVAGPTCRQDVEPFLTEVLKSEAIGLDAAA